VAALTLISGCSDDPAPRPKLEVITTAELRPELDSVALCPSAAARATDDPGRAGPCAEGRPHARVAVVADQACRSASASSAARPAGSWSMATRRWACSTAGRVPSWRACAAVASRAPGPGRARRRARVDTLIEPELELRGLHLHHPPHRGLLGVLGPSPERLDARRVVDWLIKNRSNYLQWVALDDIQGDAQRVPAWRAHPRHPRAGAPAPGVGGHPAVGLSNAARLGPSTSRSQGTRARIDARLPQLFDGLAWDRINLSFGEFFTALPEVHPQRRRGLRRPAGARAGTEMAATIHGQRRAARHYMGEQDLLYYFLVKFADPAIIPDVHTVMFYDLYEDAGGAYHHDNFDEHREYLLDRLRAGQPAVYLPETAYWVSFDVSVPCPALYVRTASSIRAAGRRARACPARRPRPVLERLGVGYWLHDFTAARQLRAGHPDELIAGASPATGASGAGGGAAIGAEEALMDQRLVAYLAGRDQCSAGATRHRIAARSGDLRRSGERRRRHRAQSPRHRRAAGLRRPARRHRRRRRRRTC
jgi:hypothetical protein